MFLLGLLAFLAGAETITDIARFGAAKRAQLRRFRPFAKGTSAHDHPGDILAKLDAESFQCCYAEWAAWLAVLALAALTITLFLLNLRRAGERAGRAAERPDNLERTAAIHRQMLGAAARRPRSRDDLVDRLGPLRQPDHSAEKQRPTLFSAPPHPAR